MMKRLFIFVVFLAMIFIPLNCITLCEKDCPCVNDNPCKYYCENRKCQPEIESRSRCYGYHVHPRECGFYYCDPDLGSTCQSKKSNGVMCNTSWSCRSDYCDLTLKTCQDKPYSPYSPDSSSDSKILLYTLLPACVFMCLFMGVMIILTKRANNRRLALVYQAQNTVIATNPVYTIQNANVCEESSPPAYSEAVTNENALIKN